MTDRELLELAAKAAGIEVVTPTMLKYGKWNPLDDDGDALRLAVKLRLVVDTDYNNGAACGSAFLDMGCCHQPDNDLSFGADRNATTRRAIVRAAAEHGEG